MCDSFRRAGLPVHKVTPAALSAEMLGLGIIPAHGVCGHTDKRIFRPRSALRVSMHRRRVSGRSYNSSLVISLSEPSPREERCPFWTRCTNLLRSTGCHVELRGTL